MSETADALSIVQVEGETKRVLVDVNMLMEQTSVFLPGADRGGEGAFIARHVAVVVSTASESNSSDVTHRHASRGGG